MRAVRVGTVAAILAGLLLAVPSGQSPEDQDPTPQSVDEFRAAVSRVLDETGVPGAGLALVGPDGIEWAGGVGWADRDARVPVEASTHFRAGSISKTFVALAIVQLYEDQWLHLEDTLASHVPDIRIDNPWDETDPVLIAHLLEHTAGFDDMHFNEVYNLRDAPGIALAEVLARNPASRRVRWRPGTRVAYSNPGYALAGHIVERVSGRDFDDYIRDEIFEPLGMATSTFALTPASARLLARGYAAPGGPPVEPQQIYLRPAGNLQTSPEELARFVQMLLNWGELGEAAIVDPEYLNRMEFPRTSLAARSGLRDGYGLGIFGTLDLPYKVIGHNGGIDGFLSAYGYSPARDAGYVVLLNSTASPQALTRISSLAIRYLKRDVTRPTPPHFDLPEANLAAFAGYYHPANPRNQVTAFAEWLLGGYTVDVRDGRLWLRPLIGDAAPLVPASEITFRREGDIDASYVFTNSDEGQRLLLGTRLYAEQRPRWPIDLLRFAMALAVLIATSPLLAALVWGAGEALGRRGDGDWWAIRGLIIATTVTLVAFAAIASNAPVIRLAEANGVSGALFLLTGLHPMLAVITLGSTWQAARAGAARGLVLYGTLTSLAHVGIAAYLGWWGLLGIRTWTY
ncbi:MAG: serine hydrolase domain-containing protein [Acidobacteriota bacterium]|nr:serine hydrolase domain-containing protein [Acidobacteriota bacterium]